MEVLLFYNDGYLHGMIHFGSVAINIEPLGKEFVVFTELEPSSFDGCPVEGDIDPYNNQKKGHYNEGSGNSGDSMTLSSSDPVIDIMVVYTPQSASASGNIQSLINASIQSTNETLQNSGINASVNLVHSAQVNYTETGNMVTDLNRLHGTNDGHMDVVHSWRDQYGADIVVLLTATGQYCGIAYWIEVPSSDAFAISRNDCSVGNYTFAHEIGHLIGGRHDSDPASSPRAYAHGYRNNPAYWRTVMAVYDDFVNRIPYWSNPNKTYGGVAMGTTHWNDNARVWNERAAIVSNFQTPSAPPPSVTLSGPSHLLVGSFIANYQTTVSNGESPFSYQWWRQEVLESGPSGQWDLISGANSSNFFYYPSSPETFYLRVDVTDDLNRTDMDYMQVEVVGPSGQSSPFAGSPGEVGEKELPELFALQANYPNPFNPSTTIRFDLPEQAFVSISVYDIMGRRVASLASSTMSAGSHNVSFDASNLSSGIYIARFTATGSSGELFKRDLKMQLIK
ncbi:zinc-dependent metalloprotease [Balneolales bacterium ANBcel1]|nr:zinc-dependent metalloprotease [Balneolales bacterium ANBcel1]